MAVSLKPLNEQVMVITGASSGIGLATARMAAEQKARLVLAARNGEALGAIENDIRLAGGEATHVIADVSSSSDIERIAETAVKHFGGFDTWVNNAGVSIFGKLEEVRDEDHRRLFDINFWGVVYGSLTAVKHLRSRGGALINLGSVASDLALPIQGMYSASKFAIRGFTDALRMELETEGAPISVTLIKPTSINTPFPHHAKNYMDREPKLPPPVYQPEEVARAILHAATHEVRDLYIGGGARAMSSMGWHAPRTMDRVGEKFMVPEQLRDEPPRDPEGTLFYAGHDGEIRGDHPGKVRERSYYTRAVIHPALTSLLVGAAGLAALSLFSASRDD
ncbi:MAG: SDR family oxidoreductase [Gemmataceae bacterium]